MATSSIPFNDSVSGFGGAILPPSLVLDEFEKMLATDPGIRLEALKAAQQMRHTPIDELDQKTVTVSLEAGEKEGKVGRRAPLNPFSSPMFKRGGTMAPSQTSSTQRKKGDDPAMKRNPLRGRLCVTIGVNAALFLVFCQSLVANRLTTGSTYAPHSQNSNIGASSATLYELGGLNANAVRSGQWPRLFWSMWMHSGWLHIGLNIICQLQYFYMLEPDWGIVRTLLIFWFAGISGNLMSAIMDPCKTTVGSSGGLFGLMGGVVPYCTEYWHSIPAPMTILVFSVFTILITLATGLTKTTDTWAHVGGLIGGLLFGFGTMTTPAAFLPRERVLKKQVRKHALLRWFQKNVNNDCKCGPREWVIRISSWLTLALMWLLCFMYLFRTYEYQPAGSLTFHGITKCCCCYDWTGDDTQTRSRDLWTCQDCDAPSIDDNPMTWKEYCDAQKL